MWDLMVRNAYNSLCLDHDLSHLVQQHLLHLQNEILFSLLIPTDSVCQVRHQVHAWRAQSRFLGRMCLFPCVGQIPSTTERGTNPWTSCWYYTTSSLVSLCLFCPDAETGMRSPPAELHTTIVLFNVVVSHFYFLKTWSATVHGSC